MTTTTLYSSKKLIFTSYKNALLRLKGISVLYLTFSIISFPVMYFLQVANDNRNNLFSEREVVYKLIGGLYPTATCISYFILLIAMTVFSGVMVNNYMHNKKAVDLYHSLPITRPQALLANYLAAATVTILPMVLCFAMVAIGNISVQATTNMAIMIIVIKLIIVILAMLSLTFFCCVSCCAGFDSAAFAVSLAVIVPCFYFLKEFTFDAILRGHSFSLDIKNITIFSPIVMYFDTVLASIGGPVSRNEVVIISFTTYITYIWYIVFAVLLLALACYLYKKRKSELAQSFNTSGAIYQFMLVAASFGCSVILSIVTNLLLGSNVRGLEDIKLLLMFLSFVYGGLFYFTFNSILTRSLKQTKKSLVTLAVCATVPTIYLAFMFFTGWFGYTTYLPNVEQVKKVSINYVGTYNNIAYLNETGEYLVIHDETVLTTEAGIKAVSDIHSNIINDISGDWRGNVQINYTLENGKVVARRYMYMTSQTTKKLVELENDPEFKAQHSPLQLAGAETVKTFEIKDGFGKNFATLNLTKQQTEMLYNAIKLDDANQNLDSKIGISGIPYCKISILYKEILNKNAQNTPSSEPMFYYVGVDVTSQSYNTLQALKDLQLDKYTTITIPENTKAIVSPISKSYMSYNMGLWRASGLEVETKDLQEKEYSYSGDGITKILPALKNYAQDDQGPILQVLLVDKSVELENWPQENRDSNVGFDYYLLPYNDAPQFIKDDFQNLVQKEEANPQNTEVVTAEKIE